MNIKEQQATVNSTGNSLRRDIITFAVCNIKEQAFDALLCQSGSEMPFSSKKREELLPKQPTSQGRDALESP